MARKNLVASVKAKEKVKNYFHLIKISAAKL